MFQLDTVLTGKILSLPLRLGASLEAIRSKRLVLSALSALPQLPFDLLFDLPFGLPATCQPLDRLTARQSAPASRKSYEAERGGSFGATPN